MDERIQGPNLLHQSYPTRKVEPSLPPLPPLLPVQPARGTGGLFDLPSPLPPMLPPDDSPEACAQRRQLVLDVLNEMEAEHEAQQRNLANGRLSAPGYRLNDTRHPTPTVRPHLHQGIRRSSARTPVRVPLDLTVCRVDINRSPIRGVPPRYNLRNRSAQNTSQVRKMCCLECPSRHFKHSALKAHMVQKHRKLLGRVNKFGCSGCYKTFSSFVEFRSHA